MENNVIKIMLFFILFALLSTVIWIAVEKRAGRQYSLIQNIRVGIFFFGGFYFVMSAVKYVLGGWENTLFEDLWDMETRTLVHYGAVFFPISVVFPAAISVILREKAVKWINVLNQYMFIGVFLLIVAFGRINNRTFTWLYVIGAVVSLVTAVWYKKDLVFAGGKECRQDVIGFLPVIVSWVVMNGIFLPNELYITNTDEFTNPYGSFFLSLLLGALVIGAVLTIFAAAVLTRRVFKGFTLLLFGIVLMSYLQYIALNGKLDLLDGNEQQWSVASGVINICLWTVVIAVVIFFGMKKRKIIKIYQGICLYICLVQVVTLGVMCATNELDSASHRAGLTNRNSLELSDGNNIIVFVLDNFDNQWFQDLKEDEQFVEPLNDFCFYDNVTSQFAHTSTAIPYLLTGVAWSEEMGEGYASIAYEKSSFLSDIKERGFDVGVYTHGGYLAKKEYALLSNYSEEIKLKTKALNTISTMWKCSMYETLPFMLKGSYMYYTDEINEMAQAKEYWDIDNDMPFYERIIGEGLSVNGAFENAFRFYHMKGAHSPYNMSEELKYEKTGREISREDQERGCLRIVYEYLEQLRDLGLYDSSTIVITADHGCGVEYLREKNMPEKPSMPILLVKKAYQKSDSMQINHAPVIQGEILPTLMRAAGGDSFQYGTCLDEVPLNAERERSYVSIYKNYVIQYTINGDANDIDSWKTKKAEFK